MDDQEESIMQQVVAYDDICKNMGQEQTESVVNSRDVEYEIIDNKESHEYPSVNMMMVSVTHMDSVGEVKPDVINIQPVLQDTVIERLHAKDETLMSKDSAQDIIHSDNKIQVQQVLSRQEETLVPHFVIFPRQDDQLNYQGASGNDQNVVPFYDFPSCENNDPCADNQAFYQQSHELNSLHVKQEIFSEVDDRSAWEVNLQCPICSKMKLSKEKLVRHIMSKHKSENVGCVKCNFVLPKKGALNIHYHVINRHTLVKCCLCDQKVSWAEVQNHMRNHVGEVSDMKTYKCSLCDYVSASIAQYKNHMMGVHVIPNRQAVKCPLCAFGEPPSKVNGSS